MTLLEHAVVVLAREAMPAWARERATDDVVILRLTEIAGPSLERVDPVRFPALAEVLARQVMRSL